MVAMTRAHIADPDIVAKFSSGAHRIRPCVGALVQQPPSWKLLEISCLHNPRCCVSTAPGQTAAD
jgi:hypothetical protein